MIENTTKRDSLLHLACSMGDGGMSGYITDMEADGARQVQHSDRLPVECRDGDEALRALGFVLGEPDPGDDLFRRASLPAGWTKTSTGHSMWTYIVDEHGRQRASIFYKAAFYDRRAFMGLTRVIGYVRTCVDEGKLPQLDPTWATREAIVQAVATLKEDSAATRELYTRPDVAAREPERAAERIAEVDAEDARYDALLKAVTG